MTGVCRNKYAVVNYWNGGAMGRVEKYVSKSRGVEGQNECFRWIIDHTPFSVSEATSRQGFVIEEVK